MAVAVHDIFSSVVLLEEMQGVGEISLFSLFVSVEHEVAGSTDDNIFKPDSVQTGLSFQMKLGDSLTDATNQIFRREICDGMIQVRARHVNIEVGADFVTIQEMMTNTSETIKFNLAGVNLLKRRKKDLLIARVWRKRGLKKSYVFAFF